MIGFLLLSLPVVAIVVLGWAAVRFGWVSPEAGQALGAFSFRFALPALVLRLVASQPLAASFDPAFFGGYLASGSLVFALVFAASSRAGRPGPIAAARATTATVSNLGFLGTPIVLAAMGPKGIGPLAMAMVCEVMILFSLGALAMAGGGGSNTRSGAILRGLVGNPVIGAIAAGVVFAAFATGLPAPLDGTLGFLGASAAPTALFAVGASLARRGDRQPFDRGAAFVAAAKLAVYPVVAWGVLEGVLRLDPFWVRSGVLLAALPSASSNFVLAQQHGLEADRVSASIALSTIASLATVPWFGWILAPGNYLLDAAAFGLRAAG